MAEQLNIFSQNCRGLKNMQKRRDLFHHIRSKKYNLACLQDVHIDKSLFQYIKAEWGYKIILSSKESRNVNRSNNFNKYQFLCDIGRVLTDPNGNYVILELNVQDKQILLVSLYGPNEDRSSFYRKLKQHITDFHI